MMNASPSPSPSPSPTAAAAAATATAVPVPVDFFLPSHTRNWSAEKRASYEQYCQQHELPAITPLYPFQDTVTSTSPDLIAARTATAAFLDTPPPVDTLEARGRMIQDGDQAIVDFGRGKAWINFDGAPNKSIKVQKTSAKVSHLLYKPYGQIWELQKNGTITRTGKKRGLGTALLDTNITTTKNNSQLYDTNKSQKLTQADIVALKSSGEATGNDLIDMLVENSATFADKTEFSQEKYLKKKKQKHCSELSVLPVTLANVCETFYEKDPRKLRSMRPDTVGMILSYANIQAGMNTLVVESCSGLILGSLMYRQQGMGYVIHAFEHNQKRTEGVKRFNFSNDIARSLLHIHLDKLLSRSVPIVKTNAKPGQPTMETTTATSTTSATATAMDTSDSNSTTTASPSSSTTSTTAIPTLPESGDLTPEYILSQQVDCLILATRYDPYSLLASVWPYLKPSGRFVIYDEVIEPLAQCHAKLCQGGLGGCEVSNLILSETFFRNIQVLPNRTHPFVNMSASGGYVLSGIKMNPNK